MPDAAAPDEAAKGTAEELWGRDPVQVFQLLRDRVCEAVRMVCDVHRLALAARPNASLANVGSGFHEPLRHAINEAQAIWFYTPISLYLDRLEGPVSSDCEDRQRTDAGSGSCYHDLALGIAVSTLHGIRDGNTAADFTGALRLRTTAGYHVTQHLASLIPTVRCECAQAIARWRAQSPKPTSPALQPVVPAASEGTAARDQGGTEQGEGDKPLDAATPTVLSTAPMSASELAAVLKQDAKRVGKFLERFRRTNRDCCVEVQNRRANEAQYRYYPDKVFPALQKHFATNG